MTAWSCRRAKSAKPTFECETATTILDITSFAFSADTMAKAGTDLNLRAGPGVQYEVVGTITVISTFLGVVIAFARKGWTADDDLVIDMRDPETVSFGFQSGLQVEELQDGQKLSLNVKKVSE